jgi:hypothetical protein
LHGPGGFRKAWGKGVGRGRDQSCRGSGFASRAAALRPRGRGIRDLGHIFGGRAVGEPKRTGQLPRTPFGDPWARSWWYGLFITNSSPQIIA